MILSRNLSGAKREPFRRVESQYYTALTRMRFLEAFVETGCAIEPSVAITSGLDPTVRFIGSHISVLKHYLRDRVIPNEGVVCLQDCVRTRNAKLLGNPDFSPKWGSYFQSLGVLLPVRNLECGVSTIVQFLETLGCPRDCLVARVSASDADLHKLCTALFAPSEIELDTQPATYYRHKIGEPGIVGRNFNLAICPPGNLIAHDIGNVIVLERDGKPQAIELAFGVSTTLSYIFGLSHVLDCHPLIGLDEGTKSTTGVQRQLEDAMITGAALLREGLEPSNVNNRTRLLRRYLTAVPALAETIGLSRQYIKDRLGQYMRLEYSDYSGAVQNGMFDGSRIISSIDRTQNKAVNREEASQKSVKEGRIAIYPPRLKPGSHVRVIAPARSLSVIPESVIAQAIENCGRLGLNVSFGKNVRACDKFSSSSVDERLDDLHSAFLDRDVDGIFSVIGGYNSNQILRGIDYELIRRNPKPLCGFSDITTLSNAIFARTGVTGFYGPHFSSLGMVEGIQYTLDYLRRALFSDLPYEIEPAPAWSDDAWYQDQVNRSFMKDTSHWVLQAPVALVTGCLVGGHLSSFSNLLGTGYQPTLEGAIIFAEETGRVNIREFDRLIQCLTLHRGFEGVRGLVIGRFQKDSHVSRSLLEEVVASKSALARIPVIANVDFGHTSPITTVPIGGIVALSMNEGRSRIEIIKH